MVFPPFLSTESIFPLPHWHLMMFIISWFGWLWKRKILEKKRNFKHLDAGIWQALKVSKVPHEPLIVSILCYLFLSSVFFKMIFLWLLFLLQFGVVKPEVASIMGGMFTPWCKDCDSTVLVQAVGIIGAVIMPHNLYLHSGLVKVRLKVWFDPKKNKTFQLHSHTIVTCW